LHQLECSKYKELSKQIKNRLNFSIETVSLLKHKKEKTIFG